MKRLFLVFILLQSLGAQTQAGSRTTRDSAAIERMRVWDRQRSAPKEGLTLPEFTGTTMDGRVFTLSQIRQRISLIMFWYPSCNCFRPEVVEPFMQFLSNPRFQIVSIMPDSFNYSNFVREYEVPGVHVNLASHKKCFELNMNTGFPTAMLVDGTGKVLRLTSAFHQFYLDEAEWTARVREALLF